MKFIALASTLAALAPLAAADSLTMSYVCFVTACHIDGYHEAGGSWWPAIVDQGCTTPPVPNMVEYCIDQTYPRGHFRYAWEVNKRCLKFSRTENVACGEWNMCWNTWLVEGPCEWRRDDIESAGEFNHTDSLVEMLNGRPLLSMTDEIRAMPEVKAVLQAAKEGAPVKRELSGRRSAEAKPMPLLG